MESTISYEEIENSISKFSNVKEGFLSEIDNAVSAINSYKNGGLSIDTGSYEGKLESIISDLKNEKEQILADCNAIERYLGNIAQVARQSVQESTAAAEQVSTFTASGETVKRA